MSVLLRNVTIIDVSSSYHQKSVDVFYKNGIIESIGKKLTAKAKSIIDAKGKYLSKSWIDTLAGWGSPGYEHRETVRTGSAAAANGGFGSVILVPNNLPVTDTASDIQYLLKEKDKMNIQVFPLGAVSKKLEGKDLAEMLDMQHAGAVAFSDGWSPIQNSQLMFKALEYVKGINSLIVQIPIHKDLDAGALMNEGVQSVAYGMSGAPGIAEEIIIHRDIALARYTNSRLHISGVSTSAGIDLIKKAKKEGVQITCSVTPFHLYYTDEAISGYDPLYKVYPVLRTKADVKALRDAVKDGVVDSIATHHKPHDWDEKVKELEYAASGMAAAETAWPMLLQSMPHISPESWVQLFVDKPGAIFHIYQEGIEEGARLSLTLFDMDTVWELDMKSKKSKAYNVPMLNQKLKGRAVLLAK